MKEKKTNKTFWLAIPFLYIWNLGMDVSNDTLKAWELDPRTNKYYKKYSRTSLTMFTSFWIANFMAIYDFSVNGFKWDVFLVYISAGVGMKITDMVSKKMNGNYQLPSDATGKETDSDENIIEEESASFDTSEKPKNDKEVQDSDKKDVCDI